jgi:uncharacterized protein YeaO (DUF488 family)
MDVWTGNIGRYTGSDALDITVKSGDRVFAPTWDMVMSFKEGRISEVLYAEMYRDLMVTSHRMHRARWDSVLAMQEVTLLCYCRPGAFCHRRLLAGFLAKLGAQDMGERVDQHPLFP